MPAYRRDAMGCPVAPCLPCHATRRLATGRLPLPASVALAIKTRPFVASGSLPIQAATPNPCAACNAVPCQTKPDPACQCVPCLEKPTRAMPAVPSGSIQRHPHLTVPAIHSLVRSCRAVPCLPCDASRGHTLHYLACRALLNVPGRAVRAVPAMPGPVNRSPPRLACRASWGSIR